MITATSKDHQNARKRLYTAIAMILFLLVTCYLFRGMLLHPTHTVVSVGGDGGKNMFTYLYQVMYGHGVWFEGMNYPYGEHIIFTDGQPAVSVILSFLNKWMHLSPGALLGIMYYLVAFSFWLGMWYTYKLLLRFGTQPLIAIAAAVVIILLSPQTLRITGHFPLSYSTFLPMLFLWSLGYYETGKPKYLLWLMLLCTLYALLHMYFLGMAVIWLMGYIGGYLFTVKKSVTEKLNHLARYSLPIIASFVVIQVFIALTDPINDRPKYPLTDLGFHWPTKLFSTNISPVWQGISDLGAKDFVVDGTHEMPYLGIVVVIMCCVGFFRFLAGRRRPPTGTAQSTFHDQWVFLAVSTLIFAVTISAFWDVSFLRGVLKPMRQFRAPERFAWIFYFVMSVYSAVLLSTICTHLYRQRQKLFSVSLAVVIFAIWAIDANGYILETGRGIPAYAENYDLYFTPSNKWASALRGSGKTPADFQAVIALPYEHNGSEKLWLGEGFSLGTVLGFMVALETKLPLMNVMMSRTSWRQTFDQVKIGGGIYAGKPVFEQLRSDKPILLLHYHNFNLTPDEAFIINNSDSVGFFNGCDLYALYPKKIVHLQEMAAKNILSVSDKLAPGDTILGAARNDVFIEHFAQQQPSGIALAGGRGQAAISGEDSTVIVWHSGNPLPTITYECAVWTKLDDVGPQHNYYTLYCRDSTGQELTHEDILTKTSMDNLPGFWFRAAKVFQVPEHTRTLEVKVYKPQNANYLALDELVIRPVNCTVISKFEDGTVFANNHRIATQTSAKNNKKLTSTELKMPCR